MAATESAPGEDSREEEERSISGAVEESRSFDGILECELVDGEKWDYIAQQILYDFVRNKQLRTLTLVGRPDESGSAFTRETGDAGNNFEPLSHGGNN